MTFDWIVKHLDKIKYFCFCFLPSGVYLSTGNTFFATALLWQFPHRLIEGIKAFAVTNATQSLFPH